LSFRKVLAKEYNDMTSQFDPETAENNEEIEMYISSTFVGGLANVAGNLLWKLYNKPVCLKRRELITEIYWNLLEKVPGSTLRLTK
jgi:hypothetical protein